MNKKKTHKGYAKRMRVTRNGKVVFHPPGKSHLNSTKSTKRKRRLRRSRIVHGKMARNIRELI